MTAVKLLLDRKREGGELSAGEIGELVAAYTKGEVPDYQMAAFAMAVCCRGMTKGETAALTAAMRDSGTVLDWSGLPVPTADKHSTGGVGDKLSLVIQPLAAACGLAVPSLTGRGLGLTGGTADKLESIPGYCASLSMDAFRRTVAECGVSMTVQTDDITPADRKLYALRDVTGTVPSIPLIVASILSKKLAEGAGTLVFDVKCGEGAFMRTARDAMRLAEALAEGAKAAGRKAVACVTAMDEPLGRAVGNAVETEEAIRILRGDADARLREAKLLSVELAARMVSLAKGVPLDAARADCEARLADGTAFGKFAGMVRLQGGDLEAFAGRCAAARASARTVLSPCDGWVARVSARRIAEIALSLGTGRLRAEDAIDPFAGIELEAVRGCRVSKGEPLATIFAPERPGAIDAAAAAMPSAFSFSDEAPQARDLMLAEVRP